MRRRVKRRNKHLRRKESNIKLEKIDRLFRKALENSLERREEVLITEGREVLIRQLRGTNEAEVTEEPLTIKIIMSKINTLRTLRPCHLSTPTRDIEIHMPEVPTDLQ